jgi:hypothetical protein
VLTTNLSFGNRPLPHHSPPLFVIPTRISCYAALDTTACAPFFKERRMMFANATNINRKSGGA